jgi:alpha-1,2-glucosyltransferase
MAFSSHTAVLALIVLIAAIFGYTIITMNVSLHADEGFHAGQIWLFYSGEDRLAGNITVPPTYHYIIGKIVKFTGGYHDNLLRLISLCIALLSIPVIYHAAKFYNSTNAWEKTLHIYFTPFIFPYFFVLYTDIWSLFAIASSMLLALNRRFYWAGLAGGVAVLVRQDNIAWVGLIYLYVCFEFVNEINKTNAICFARNALTKGAIFNLIFLGFLAFVYINGGVAIGDADAHKISAFNFSNLHVFLICCWLLFLPFHISQIPTILPLLRKPAVIISLLVGFVIYVGTLKNTHSYNRIMYDYFVHNAIIHLLTDYALIKILSFFLAAWTILSFINMPLPDWRWRVLILVAPLAAISHPLIEPRYYIPAFFIIHILRPRLSSGVEFFTLSLYIISSAYILYGTTLEKLFL